MGWMDGFLVLAVCFCVYTDVKTRKIKNVVTFPLMGIGLVYNVATKGLLEGGLFSLKGLLFCGILSLILYLVNGFGMGDVKLLMAIGAIRGFRLGLDVLVFSLFAAVLFSFFRNPRAFAQAIKNVWRLVKGILYGCPYKITEAKSAMTMAYAVYILCGLVVSYFIGGEWTWPQLFKN